MKFLNIPSFQCIYCFNNYDKSISEDKKWITFIHPIEVGCQYSEQTSNHLLRDFEVEY